MGGLCEGTGDEGECREDVQRKFHLMVFQSDKVALTNMGHQERQHLEEIYQRYLRNEAQSEAAKAIRAGRIIP